MLLKNKTNDELLREIIDLGLEIKGNIEGGYGSSNEKTKAKKRISELSNRGIDVYKLQFDFKGLNIKDDTHGLYDKDSLEYALQFI